MVKKMEITWHGSAGFGDDLGIDVDVRRFGTKSFDVGFEGAVDGRPVFTAVATYVAVKHGTIETIPVPDEFRASAASAS